MTFPIDLIAYTALLINLVSMTMSNMIRLRLLSTIANLLYIIYCLLIAAWPLVIGGIIAVLIHLYHTVRLLTGPGNSPVNRWS